MHGTLLASLLHKKLVVSPARIEAEGGTMKRPALIIGIGALVAGIQFLSPPPADAAQAPTGMGMDADFQKPPTNKSTGETVVTDPNASTPFTKPEPEPPAIVLPPELPTVARDSAGTTDWQASSLAQTTECAPGEARMIGEPICEVRIACSADGVWPLPDFAPTNGKTCADDNQACTFDLCFEGVCLHEPVTKCSGIAKDGCCPAACSAMTDADCASVPAQPMQPMQSQQPGQPMQPQQAPQDANCAEGQPCTDDGNPCTADICRNGLCTHDAGNAGQECRAASGICQEAALCDGIHTDCPQNVFKSGTEICRPADPANPCDTVERCTGSGPDCPPDISEKAGDSCSTGNACIVGETCMASGVCAGGSARVCDDGNACTAESCADPGGCKFTPIVQCANGDGCCPANCNAGNDGDCAAVCGNGAVEPGEECDDGPNSPTPCPTSCTATQDCEISTLVGEACQRQCITTLAPANTLCRAARGICDAEELCNGMDAACPKDDFQPPTTVCRAVAATDVCNVPESCTGNGPDCPADAFKPAGTVISKDRCEILSCNAEHAPSTTLISSCAHGDGCCPAGCNAASDNDCQAACGDGHLDIGERCDTGISAGSGSCPASCDDSDPTTDDKIENPGSCQAHCSFERVRCVMDNSAYEPGPDPQNPCRSCDLNNPRQWTFVAKGTSCTTSTVGPEACHEAPACNGAGACVQGDFVSPKPDDGCCDKANLAPDNDCQFCGNGRVDPGERCDTASTSGSGKCPLAADCEDEDPTTASALKDGGTCQARCEYDVVRCSIDGKIFKPGDVNPANPCEMCDLAHPAKWTPIADGTSCREGTNRCAPSLCAAGKCVEKPVLCPNDGCHTAGKCDPGSGACTYQETITKCAKGDKCCPAGCSREADDFCPAPVCGNGKLEPGEACDGPIGCGEGAICDPVCRLCLEMKKPEAPAAREPKPTPAAPFAYVTCLNASPDTERANGELLALRGRSDALFCDSDTATACMIFGSPVARAAKGVKAGASGAASWKFVQESGRSLALSPPIPKMIEKSQVVMEASPPPPLSASEPIPSGAVRPDEEIRRQIRSDVPGSLVEEREADLERWVLNRNFTFETFEAKGEQKEFTPKLGAKAIPLKGLPSETEGGEAILRVFCFTPPGPPLFLQTEGAPGPEEKPVYDKGRLIERIRGLGTAKSETLAPDLGDTSSFWNPHDVYRFILEESGSSAPKAGEVVPPASALQSLAVYVGPGLAVQDNAPKPGCSLAPRGERPQAAAGFLILAALLTLPAGAVATVRILSRNRQGYHRWRR